MSEHKYADVLRAIADGRPVQGRWPNSSSPDWWDFNPGDHAFHMKCEWRIKPKPVVKKWKWLIDLNPKGTQHLYITPEHFSSKEKILEITPRYKVLQRMDETLIEEEED